MWWTLCRKLSYLFFISSLLQLYCECYFTAEHKKTKKMHVKLYFCVHRKYFRAKVFIICHPGKIDGVFTCTLSHLKTWKTSSSVPWCLQFLITELFFFFFLCSFIYKLNDPLHRNESLVLTVYLILHTYIFHYILL